MNGALTTRSNEAITWIDEGKQHMEIGFAVIKNVYSSVEVAQMIVAIDAAVTNKSTFRKGQDVFAIRQLLQEVPELKKLIFTNRLLSIIQAIFGKQFFVVKSIYFDKPASSNWFVAYHQDLTISVKEKQAVAGFGPWTAKQNQFAVQPPVELLQNNFTVRIHLDDTDENNGALKVVPASQKRGIVRPETIDWQNETEIICTVPKGGIMLMRPLLLHASGRTTNNKGRRVVHIEFSNQHLPEPLQWAEYLPVPES